MKTIVLVGGGSGGHIAPLIAVANYIKSQQPSVRVIAVTESRGRFSHMFSNTSSIDQVKFVSAGKLRRYHGESWLVRIFDVHRNLLNTRDMFRLGWGLLQSLWLLQRHKPDLIFIKGGYVGVPIGFAARLRGVRYVTHDSDALPGLANRLIASRAVINAVGMPEENYDYQAEKIRFVGIPVDSEFHPLKATEAQRLRDKQDVPKDAIVLFITGGSNGAQRIDTAIHSVAAELLEAVPKLRIIHLVGLDNEKLYADYPKNLQKRIMVARFLRPFHEYTGLADVVVTRSGASTLAEFAAQAKPCVVIPNPLLTGGHQLKNALALEKERAAVVIQEDVLRHSPQPLLDELLALIQSEVKRKELGQRLNTLFPQSATSVLGNLLLKLLREESKQDKN